MNLLAVRLALGAMLLVLGIPSNCTAATNPIVRGVTTGGTLAGGTNFHTFTVAAGETIKVLAVRTNSSGVIMMGVYRADGLYLGGDLGVFGRADALARCNGPALPAGDFYISIWNYSGGSAPFGYEVTLLSLTGTNVTDAGDGPSTVPGDTRTGRLSRASDIDVITFEASANEVVKVLAARTNGAGVIGMEVFGPDGTLVGSDLGIFGRADALARLDRIVLPASGQYRVVIWDLHLLNGVLRAGPLDFEVSLVSLTGTNSTDSGDSSVIAPGETRGGRLTWASDTDVMTFQGSSNDVVRLLAVRTNGTGVIGMEVYGPNGTLVGSDLGIGGRADAVARLSRIVLPASGQHRVVIWDLQLLNGVLRAGALNYVCSLVKNPGPNVAAPDGGAIASRETRSGSIGVGDLDTFEFNGWSCRSVFIRVTNNNPGTGSLVVELQSPRGVVVASRSGVNPVNLIVPALPETGRYLIICQDLSGTGTFNYGIRMEINPEPPTNGPAGPQLISYPCTNQVIISWLTNATSYALESTTNLAAPILWQPVTAPSIVLEDQFYVIEPRTLPQKYYRLKWP